jgi:hypothetical protein
MLHATSTLSSDTTMRSLGASLGGGLLGGRLLAIGLLGGGNGGLE